jgi:hypothetical protein
MRKAALVRLFVLLASLAAVLTNADLIGPH